MGAWDYQFVLWFHTGQSTCMRAWGRDGSPLASERRVVLGISTVLDPLYQSNESTTRFRPTGCSVSIIRSPNWNSFSVRFQFDFSFIWFCVSNFTLSSSSCGARFVIMPAIGESRSIGTVGMAPMFGSCPYRFSNGDEPIEEWNKELHQILADGSQLFHYLGLFWILHLQNISILWLTHSLCPQW
jgi:hypothetical protein